jgi:hypothetical protein
LGRQQAARQQAARQQAGRQTRKETQRGKWVELFEKRNTRAQKGGGIDEKVVSGQKRLKQSLQMMFLKCIYKESLLKGKDKYDRPPCNNLLGLVALHN